MTDEAEKRGQLIRYLEDALALADELKDGNAGFLIKSALEAGSRQFKPDVTPPRTEKVRFATETEKLGQLIRYLEDARTLADELEDGHTEYLIKRALRESKRLEFKRLEFKPLGPPFRIAKMQFAIWLVVAAAIGATMPRMLGPMLAPPITSPDSGPVPDSSPAKEAAESVAEKLRVLPVKYNRPGTLHLGDSSPVEVVIQTDQLQPIDELLKGFPGEIRKAMVQVGTRASASLTGPKDRVEITLRGDPLRAVTKDAPVTWVWDVRPLKPGDVQVILEVFTHVKFGKDEGRVQMRVLQDTWTVNATAFEWTKYYVSEIEPIQTFAFAIVSAIVGALAYFGFKGWTAKPSEDDT